MHEVVNSGAVSSVVASGRRRRTLAIRGDYLKITKEELRKELRLRGLRTSSKRIEMIRKLEKWEQERREQERREQDLAAQRLHVVSSPLLSASLNTTTGNGGGIVGLGPTRSTCRLGANIDDGCIPFDLAGSSSSSSENLPFKQMSGLQLQQGDGRRMMRRQSNKIIGVQGDGEGDRINRGNVEGVNEHDSAEPLIELESLVLWRHPFTTLHYFSLEVFTLLGELLRTMYQHKLRVCIAFLLTVCMAILYYTDGSHQVYLEPLKKQAVWYIYWIGLGVLSSVGLGTGLHTFVLYLGPHIAAVTLAAHECQRLDFPEPPYPDEIKCPEQLGPSVPSIWAIMSKVRTEAFLWGAGTALGELPPYFMARAARSSGQVDDEDLEAVEELRALEAADRTQLSWVNRMKLLVDDLIGKVGFFGILACASIPNPLFDLAGIMCGHCGVNFTTFFGATLLGKAVFKMHFQKLFVIFACGETHVKMLLNFVRAVPVVGPSIVPIFEVYLEKQKDKLKQGKSAGGPEGSLLSSIFEKLVIVMVVYFVLSIVNSMAQSYHKRISRAIKNNNKNL